MTKWYQRTERASSSANGRRSVLWLALIVIALILLVIVSPLWLRGLANLLLVDQEPREADAILILGGGDGSREDRGIALYREGWAPLLITSGERIHAPGIDKTFAKISAEYLTAQGIPLEDILLFNGTTSTFDEAESSLSLAKERGHTALLVVTDSFHTRRASLVFAKVYRHSDVQVTFVAAHPAWYNAGSWWREERAFLAVLEEYVKLVFYAYKGYIV